MIYPLLQEIIYDDPIKFFSLFAESHGAILLDSAELREGSGRYSFIAIDPFLILRCKNHTNQLGQQYLTGNPFDILQSQLAKYPLVEHPNLPPFQGGIAGFLSYDLCHHLETFSKRSFDDIAFPDLIFGFYDLVIGFDHLIQRAWIFSSGYPLQEPAARVKKASSRCAWLIKTLECYTQKTYKKFSADIKINSNFTEDTYQQAVKKVKEYILAGDIFEANISQRFKAELPDAFSTFELYCQLRLKNPAPFAAYLEFGDTVIASASPERFVRLQNNFVEARPIKGTRARGATPDQDQLLASQLQQSEKDNAENIMIVDLLRNDLSRVCESDSVHVPHLCRLESYKTVHHLVSVITGKLQEGYQAIDLLRATFPGGSITGAPKIRAMEIIAEIEPTCRGPYCGSIGYIGFQGNMDFSITIRTFAIKNRILTFQAGGAVVADSDPAAEYQETLIKSRALRYVLEKMM